MACLETVRGKAMTQYSFRVGTPTGSIQTLEVAGDSPEAARRSLEGKGYFVFYRQEQARTLSRLGRPAFLAPRVTPRALLVFNQELLALVRAGLPILSALDLLRERGQQPRLRSLLEVVAQSPKCLNAQAPLSRCQRIT
jgi:type IV pilus assembly protein PilC